jgi:hypothetical protein
VQFVASAIGIPGEQRLIHQGDQGSEVRAGHRPGRGQIEATAEERQFREQSLEMFIQPVEGRIEDGPHAGVPGLCVAHFVRQEVQAVADLPRDFGGREMLERRSRHEDPQRIAIHQLADPHHWRSIVRTERKPRARLGGPLQEQSQRVILLDIPQFTGRRKLQSAKVV